MLGKYFPLVVLSSFTFSQPLSASGICRTSPTPEEKPYPSLYKETKVKQKPRSLWCARADASLLYWEAQQDNMEPAVITKVDEDGTGVSRRIVNMKQGYTPGYRLGLGANLDSDNMIMELIFTHYDSKLSRKGALSDSDEGFFYPRWLDAETATALGDTFAYNARWYLDMNFIDFMFSRTKPSHSSLQITPYGGVRGGWSLQQQLATYLASLTVVGDVANYTKSWGVGPRAGVHLNWAFSNSFSFYSDGSLDVLFSQFSLRSINEVNNEGEVTFSRYFRQKSINTVRGHFDIEVGLGWSCKLEEGCSVIDVLAGYSLQTFFGQNMFRYITSNDLDERSILPNGNLYVQGVNITLSVKF